MKLKTKRTFLAIFISFILFFLLLQSSNQMGLCWDESIYFNFSQSIIKWAKTTGPSFNPLILDKYWGYSYYYNPHPPLFKTGSAIFSQIFKFLNFPTKFRIFHYLFLATSAGSIFFLLSGHFSIFLSLMAIFFIFFQPRFFGHSLLATTDAPLAITWLLVTLFLWKLKTVSSNKQWIRAGYFTCIILAVSIKFPGLLLFFPLSAYFIIRKEFKEIKILLYAFFTGLCFTVLISPEKWDTPFNYIIQYICYPFYRNNDVELKAFYFGENHLSPPWHYFWIMSYVSTPFLLWPGCIPWLNKTLKKIRNLKTQFSKNLSNSYNNLTAEQHLFLLLITQLVFCTLLFSLPFSPRYDGIRQFLFFFPILGLTSWLGYIKISETFKKKFPGFPILAKTIPLLIALILSISTYEAHPFELTYYNQTIGGPKGAEKKGFELSYYFETCHPKLIQYLNTLPSNSKIFIYPCWPLILEWYQQENLLRKDLSFADLDTIQSANYYLIFRRRSDVADDLFYDYPSLFNISFKKVPLVQVKKRI